MPPIKRRSSRLSTKRWRSRRDGVFSKSPHRRSSYWLRGDPRPAQIASTQHVAAAGRRPLYPHFVHSDRLIALRPECTLDEARRRQEALKSLREVADANKGDVPTGYYCVALQGEVLDAPLKVDVDRERVVLRALPDRLFMTFSRRTDDVAAHERLATHPLERSKLSTTLGPYKELFQAERTIAKAPYKILDAPELKDDFYYNLIDWSSKNILAVGLGRVVYLWKAVDAEVEELNASDSDRSEVTSVGWSQGATALAVGSRMGSLQLWDPATKQSIIDFSDQPSRVGSLSWNFNILASGCRDGTIRCYDHRQADPTHAVAAHKSEVCGLKWSSDNIHLASGGNDNRVYIWDVRRTETPLWSIAEHSAAVKAISWSPHNNKYFVTGGGLKDVHIKMWKLSTMERVMNVSAHSQVCGLHWSENVNEIVSTHGYNNNAIQLWKASTMGCLGTVPGHTTRIVYLTVAPDGESIATGSGDESIRFFRVFPPAQNHRTKGRSLRDKINLSAR